MEGLRQISPIYGIAFKQNDIKFTATEAIRHSSAESVPTLQGILFLSDQHFFSNVCENLQPLER